MHSSKIREKTKKEEGMGSRKLDPTQEGSVRKSQAESCTAGLKSNHSRLEQENGRFQEDVFGRMGGGEWTPGRGSLTEKIEDKLEDMLKTHHSFVNKKKERQLETLRKIKSCVRKLRSKYEAN